jgi:hypothetical protein
LSKSTARTTHPRPNTTAAGPTSWSKPAFAVIRFSNQEVIGDIDRVLERIAATALKGPTAGSSPLPLSHSGEGFPSERDS